MELAAQLGRSVVSSVTEPAKANSEEAEAVASEEQNPRGPRYCYGGYLPKP